MNDDAPKTPPVVPVPVPVAALPNQTVTTSTIAEPPWWVKLATGPGLAVLLVLWGIGLLPGIRSPLVQFYDDHKALAHSLELHERATQEAVRVNRLICRGVWRDVPVVQEQCGPATQEGALP